MMGGPRWNLAELHWALLDKWAEVPVERPKRLVASMPQRWARNM